MARQFTAVELTGLDPAAKAGLNAYLAYESARTIRQMLMRRLVLFVGAVGVLTLGLHYLPVAALVVTSVLAVGVLTAAGKSELEARRLLEEELTSSADHQ